MIPVKSGKVQMNRFELLAVIGSMQKNAMIGNGEKSPTLASAMGMGGGQIPMIITKNKGDKVWENYSSRCGII